MVRALAQAHAEWVHNPFPACPVPVLSSNARALDRCALIVPLMPPPSACHPPALRCSPTSSCSIPPLSNQSRRSRMPMCRRPCGPPRSPGSCPTSTSHSGHRMRSPRPRAIGCRLCGCKACLCGQPLRRLRWSRARCEGGGGGSAPWLSAILARFRPGGRALKMESWRWGGGARQGRGSSGRGHKLGAEAGVKRRP
eukprot:scaffold4683_cov107-Isochrysis_galbana.AAC.4